MGKNKKSKKCSSTIPVATSQPNISRNGITSSNQNGVNKVTPLLKSGTTLKSTLTYPSLTSTETNPVSGAAPSDPIVHNIDHSIARIPINLGVQNVRQILGCIKEGTEEVKDYILNECNIIYECKWCSALFRSLANFIAHKRVYCKDHYCERMFGSQLLHFDETSNPDDADDANEVTENVEDDVNVNDNDHIQQNQTDDSGNTTGSDLCSPLLSTVISTPESKIKAEKRKYINECAEKIAFERMRENNAKQLELNLSPIKTNPNAVFQRLAIDGLNRNSGDAENTKVTTETITVEFNDNVKHDDSDNEIAEKRQKTEDLRESQLIQSELSDEKLTCNFCGIKYRTPKTLRVHINTLHSDNRMLYPCPLCSLSFRQLSNASRHLMNIHKKTKSEIMTLKEVMKRRAFSANSSENSSEIDDISDGDDDLVDDTDKNNDIHMATADNSSNENIKTIPMRSNKTVETNKVKGSRIPNTPCSYNCGHTFDWLPAKISHEKSCKRRAEMETPHEHMHHINNRIQFNKEKNVLSSKTPVITVPQFHQYLSSVPNHQSSKPNQISPPLSSLTCINLPPHVEDQIGQIIDVKSLRCLLCSNQDFMNLNQLVQHAVNHCGYHVFRCNGCSFLTIRELDMKNHLINNHNIIEEMIDKHYQKISTPSHNRIFVPVKAKKSINGPNNGQNWNGTNGSIHDSKDNDKVKECSAESSLKIHLRTMENNSSKKCYKIVDK